jgi:hypothetical protein
MSISKNTLMAEKLLDSVINIINRTGIGSWHLIIIFLSKSSYRHRALVKNYHLIN